MTLNAHPPLKKGRDKELITSGRAINLDRALAQHLSLAFLLNKEVCIVLERVTDSDQREHKENTRGLSKTAIVLLATFNLTGTVIPTLW